MIVSATRYRPQQLSWLSACVLSWATLTMPCSDAEAQDFETVEMRLGGIVADGELTLKQAAIMLDALKREMDHTSSNEVKLHAYFEEVWAKLQAAVSAGQMSAEDAASKMAAIKRAKLSADNKKSHYETLGEQLKGAVRAGKLTEEEAWAKWKAVSDSKRPSQKAGSLKKKRGTNVPKSTAEAKTKQ